MRSWPDIKADAERLRAITHLQQRGAFRTACNLWADAVTTTGDPDLVTCPRCVEAFERVL